jgi:Cu-processing system ATP-binding protein
VVFVLIITVMSVGVIFGREPIKGSELFGRLDMEKMESVASTLLKEVGISKDIPPSTPIGSLSGGERQAVAIARAMHFDSDLIILDEPTTGLDPKALIRLKGLIQNEKAKGKTILVTSHIMQFVEEMADEILYLLEGEIYFKGSIKELLERTDQTDFEHAIAAITTTESHA